MIVIMTKKRFQQKLAAERIKGARAERKHAEPHIKSLLRSGVNEAIRTIKGCPDYFPIRRPFSGRFKPAGIPKAVR